jgi:hypothetical protein
MKNTKELGDQAEYQTQAEVVVAVVFSLCFSCKSVMNLQSIPFTITYTHTHISKEML